MGSEVEMDSDGEREKKRERKKRARSRSRDGERDRSKEKRERSRDREKRSKHKKHKKDKKKHKKRDASSDEGGADTGNEGGETPEKGRSRSPMGGKEDQRGTPEPLPTPAEKLPGLAKYESEGEDGEIEPDPQDERKERKEHHRDDEKRKERKEYHRDVEPERKEERRERKEYQRDGSRERDRGREKDDDGRERDRGREKERSRRKRSRSRDRNRSGDNTEEKRDAERSKYRREEQFSRNDSSRNESFGNESSRNESSRNDRNESSRNESSRNGNRDGRRDPKESDEPGEIGVGKDVVSLSVEETNKLRAKLGLKPLNISTVIVEEEEDGTKEGTLIPGDRDKTRHLPADHWGERDNIKKQVEKIATKKDKRNAEKKLAAVKGLGESDSEEDDPEAWVQRQRKKIKEKEEAEKRAKVMEELDQEFGVQDLVDEEMKKVAGKQYTGKDLKGLRVEHSSEAFGEASTVLTLQDGDILSDKYEDVLVNVNIVDDERTKKSLSNIKAGKEGYQAYDQEEVDDLTGEVKKKQLLYQYQEELEGAKKDSFTLEGQGNFSEEVNRQRELNKIRHKLRQQNAISLEMPAPQLATDFYTDKEMEEKMASFKKPKKTKKKVRKKMLKADDLLAMTSESSLLPANFGEKQKKRAARIGEDDGTLLPDGRLPDDHDDLPVVPDMSGVQLEEEDPRLALKLAVARKLKKNRGVKEDSVDRITEEVRVRASKEKDKVNAEEGKQLDLDMVMDQTQEFCRGLGEVGHYELSGMVDTVDKELLDFEQSLETDGKYGERMRSAVEWSKMDDRREEEREVDRRPQRGTWEEVEGTEVEEGKWKEGTRRQHKPNPNNEQGGGKEVLRPAILEDEALARTGMGAALKMAMQKGYLDAEEKKSAGMGLTDLIAKKYQIEDKSRDHEEDDRKRRGGGRDRGYGGPTSTFTEKKGYKPCVTLEYVDDGGRALSSKEAFRFLSHKFHGKGSGKLKTEKRHRKVQEEKLMEKMSSVDTPLQTLSKLQAKTKDLATPYLVLSGSKQTMGGHTSLKK